MTSRSLILALLLVPALAFGEGGADVSTESARREAAWSSQRVQTHALGAGVLLASGGLALGLMARQDVSHAERALTALEARQSMDAARFNSSASNVLFALAGLAVTCGLVAGLTAPDASTPLAFQF